MAACVFVCQGIVCTVWGINHPQSSDSSDPGLLISSAPSCSTAFLLSSPFPSNASHTSPICRQTHGPGWGFSSFSSSSTCVPLIPPLVSSDWLLKESIINVYVLYIWLHSIHLIIYSFCLFCDVQLKLICSAFVSVSLCKQGTNWV